MQTATPRPQVPAAIQTDLGAIFVSAGRYGDLRIGSKSVRRTLNSTEKTAGFSNPDRLDHAPIWVVAFLHPLTGSVRARLRLSHAATDRTGTYGTWERSEVYRKSCEPCGGPVAGKGATIAAGHCPSGSVCSLLSRLRRSPRIADRVAGVMPIDLLECADGAADVSFDSINQRR